jgi:uncharacterized membrane protein
MMPDKVASHWNMAGEVNGYMSKFWGLFLLPIMAFFMAGLFLILPKIDPIAKNFDTFRESYNKLIVSIILFLVYVHGLTVVWNLGIKFDLTRFMLPSLGVFFIVLGNSLSHVKRNWFVGIRTPWTLSSDTVWEKTHRLGARLFEMSGILVLFGIFVPEAAFWILIISVILSTITTILYSYLLYKKEQK